MTGNALNWMRAPTDIGFASPSLYPSVAWNSATKGHFSVWHEMARAGFLIAFSCGFINTVANCAVFRYVSPKVCVALHVISIPAWTIASVSFFSKLFSMDTHEWRWAVDVQDSFMVCVYPMIDLPCLYAFYYAWYKGKKWDWDQHRDFGLSAYVMLTVFAIIYFLTNEAGPVFSTTTPVGWRIIFALVAVFPWFLYYWLPFTLAALKLPTEKMAKRKPEDWWTVDGVKH